MVKIAARFVGETLQSDTRGRMRTSAPRREALLEEFDRSGLSGKQFAELTGLKYQTFATWLQKRRRQGQSSSKPADMVRWEGCARNKHLPAPAARSYHGAGVFVSRTKGSRRKGLEGEAGLLLELNLYAPTKAPGVPMEMSAWTASRLRTLREARLHQTEHPNALPASWRCPG
jgi:hypothetical protein